MLEEQGRGLFEIAVWQDRETSKWSWQLRGSDGFVLESDNGYLSSTDAHKAAVAVRHCRSRNEVI